MIRVPGVLALNSGSSSIKAALFTYASEGADPEETPRWERTLDTQDADLQALFADFPEEIELTSIGHRVVHGGLRPDLELDEPLTESLLADITQAEALAPEHNAQALAGIAFARQRWPHVQHVIVFDHLFDAQTPPEKRIIAGPYAWYTDLHIRRIGFHGISHHDAAERARGEFGDEARIVTVHLGSGCSLAASQGGRFLDTTMGMTPLDGLVMANRCGALDPGVIFYLLRNGWSAENIEKALNEQSGWHALSGISADIREVVAAAKEHEERALLALEIIENTLAKGIAAMAASLQGIDAVVWTGRIGEHMPELRDSVLGRLAFLGCCSSSVAGNRVSSLILKTREEWAIARRCLHRVVQRTVERRGEAQRTVI